MGLLAVAAAIVGGAVLFKRARSDGRNPTSDPRQVRAPVTFSNQIAPIIYNNCSGCHRPGQAGPFNLLTYGDVKKRAKQIAEVTQRRFMPPWPPEPGANEFIGQRVLSTDQISLIQQWVSEGAPEGNPAETPALPRWPEGWALGKPDLIVEMPEPYTLPPAGRDVYRNFVVPIPLKEPRYIRAVEFRPNNKSVHHAFMLFDRTRQSRRLDEESPEIGFGGMGQPGNAESPADTFLSWQPGKIAQDTRGSAWKLEPKMDLVLQLHMQTTGKPERVQPVVAFYFTDQPSTNLTFKIGLDSFAIDIPAGETDYKVEDSYQLPVDVEVTAVYPHAHYLGKQLRGFALLPDASIESLLLIKNWDFNWQGDYRYAKPIFLPKGSVIHMQFTYDNSTNNVRNPHNPPRRVEYGVETTDEMANLSFLFRLKNRADLEKLAADYQYKAVRSIVAFNEWSLRRDPSDARAHTQLGKAMLALGKWKDAAAHFNRAIELKAASDDAHYHLGLILEDQNQLANARREYELAVRYNPEHLEAQNNLGLICLKQGDLDQAELHFKAALALAEDDAMVKENIGLLQQARAARARGQR